MVQRFPLVFARSCDFLAKKRSKERKKILGTSDLTNKQHHKVLGKWHVAGLSVPPISTSILLHDLLTQRSNMSLGGETDMVECCTRSNMRSLQAPLRPTKSPSRTRGFET